MNEDLPPLALQSLSRIEEYIGRRRPAFFLDFDATLAPAVSHPDLAEIPPESKDALSLLVQDHLVCIVSGRDLLDLRPKVGLVGVYYAADHGHRVLGPPGSGIDFEVGPEDRHELETASYELEHRLRHIAGVVVQTKGVSLSVHYRMVADADRPLVDRIVREVLESAPGLKLTKGSYVHELIPDTDWGKGQAVLWLLQRLRLDKRDACPICLGDDLADEDMFAVVAGRGLGVVVGDPKRPTQASYMLRDCGEVAAFLRVFVARAEPAAATPGRDD